MEWYEIILLVFGIILVWMVLEILGGSYILLLMIVKPFRFSIKSARTFLEKYDCADFSNYDSHWERERFELPLDGVTIVGETIRHPKMGDGPEKVVILSHGQTMNRMASVRYGQCFYDLGYHLVIYDARYFGESRAKYSTLADLEQKDLARVIEYAKTVFGPDIFLGLHGESMGAATSLLALNEAKDVKFVVADCSFSDLSILGKSWVENRLHHPGFLFLPLASRWAKKWFHFDFDSVRPLEAVKKTEVPICFIHGNKDLLIPAWMSQKMFESTQNSLSELHLFEGARHAGSFRKDPERYRETVMAFVEKIETSIFEK